MISTKKIKYILQKNKNLFRYFQYMYNLVLHPNRLMAKKSFGSLNKDRTILIIRPSTDDGVQGLMSLFIQAMHWIEYANQKCCIPFVDFKNYKTQYSNGIDNVWEYYFTQPSDLCIDDVYNSCNVNLSGVSLKRRIDIDTFRGEVFNNKDLCKRCYDLIWNNIDLSEEVYSIVDKENKDIHVENCLGLYIRGTDYVKLKPPGEYVQPTIEDVIKKVYEFLAEYGKMDIFLVTEDNDYYQLLQQQFGDQIRLVSFDTFIENYDGRTFLSQCNVLNEDKKRRGMDYLVKIILLSKCKYLISSITMGSIAAYCFNGGKYEDEYIFDLGLYR